MKTAKEWFEELPEPYRTQVLENCMIQYKKYESLREAIYDSFIWITSPQGYDYWECFYNLLPRFSAKRNNDDLTIKFNHEGCNITIVMPYANLPESTGTLDERAKEYISHMFNLTEILG